MAEEEAKPLAYISETVLKKRRSTESLALTRKAQLELGKYGQNNNKKKKVEDIKRPEEFIKQFRAQTLGKYGMVCIEDLVHEIANVGQHFKEVIKFLGPFLLSKPGGFLGKKQRFKDGGESGDREDQINDLISKMN
ncbi:hypothetical protein Pint_30290 [Pistacia integerrima]|uniref:Uncharacterized protein n=1 Tax=Pistacia integerrima TaxID=434235 RepID=A0ACC0X3H0_9ROSI|nr:hypothetical protein Pint_30290 [Pistacia integerrima]